MILYIRPAEEDLWTAIKQAAARGETDFAFDFGEEAAIVRNGFIEDGELVCEVAVDTEEGRRSLELLLEANKLVN